MAYEPTNWKTGDVVTSAKLNKMEQGIANGGSDIVVVKLEYYDAGKYTASVSYVDVVAALSAGKTVLFALTGVGVSVAEMGETESSDPEVFSYLLAPTTTGLDQYELMYTSENEWVSSTVQRASLSWSE